MHIFTVRYTISYMLPPQPSSMPPASSVSQPLWPPFKFSQPLQSPSKLLWPPWPASISPPPLPYDDSPLPPPPDASDGPPSLVLWPQLLWCALLLLELFYFYSI